MFSELLNVSKTSDASRNLRGSKYFPGLLTFAAIFIVWQLGVTMFAIPSFLLPSPLSIILRLMNPSIQWGRDLLVTSYEILVGFLLAVVFGIGAATLMILSERVRLVMHPVLVVAQIIPKIAFVPILFIWMGFNDLPRITTVLLVCFFPIVIDTLTGFSLVEPDMVDLVRSYSPSKFDLLTKAMFPTALPSVFSGMKVSITTAVIGALIAEFVSSNSGLGFIIISAQTELDTSLAFAAATLIILLGLIFYCVLEVLERLTIRWKRRVNV